MKNKNLTRLVIGLAFLVILLAITMATQIGKESYQNVVTEIVTWLNGLPVLNGDYMDIASLSDKSTIKVITGQATGESIDNVAGTKNWRWAVYQPKTSIGNNVYEYQFMGYLYRGGNNSDLKMVLITIQQSGNRLTIKETQAKYTSDINEAVGTFGVRDNADPYFLHKLWVHATDDNWAYQEFEIGYGVTNLQIAISNPVEDGPAGSGGGKGDIGPHGPAATGHIGTARGASHNSINNPYDDFDPHSLDNAYGTMGLSGISNGYPQGMPQRPMIINVTSNGSATPHQHAIPQQPLVNHQHAMPQPQMNNVTMTHKLSDNVNKHIQKLTNVLDYIMARSQKPDTNKK